MKRLMDAPPWDLVVFDEAHHLTAYRRTANGTKTENYKLAEALQGAHSRSASALGDAAPGRPLPVLDAGAAARTRRCSVSPQRMVENRHRLNTVVFRRTKADACRPDGSTLFARRWVHTESFMMSGGREDVLRGAEGVPRGWLRAGQATGQQGAGARVRDDDLPEDRRVELRRRAAHAPSAHLDAHASTRRCSSDQELDIDAREQLFEEARS